MPDLALTRVPRRPRSAPPRAPRASWRGRRAGGRDDLVVTLVTQHAESVLRITRRLSLCDADAEDAYQRAIEILLHRAGSLDPVRAPAWLRTVARNEALAIRAQRTGGLSRDEQDPDAQIDVDRVSTEEQVDRVDRFRRAAEALRDLKPDEARALWLRAEGYSYDEIARTNAWTYTKVNRLLAEGRARFLSRYATIESGGACAEWQPVLSAIVDGEADPAARREAGVHLRSCLGCRATLRQLRSSAAGMRMVLPAAALGGTCGGGPPDAGGALRFVEGLWAAAHERAAVAVVGAQASVDGFSAGKVAAMTASVAALAGGGMVAVERGVVTPALPAATAARPTAEPLPAPAPPGALSASGAVGTLVGAGGSGGSPAGEPASPSPDPEVRSARPDPEPAPAATPEFTPPAEAAEPASPAREFRPPGEFVGGSSPASSDAPAPARTEFGASSQPQHRGEFAP